MRAKQINEGGAFKSRRHYLLGTTLAHADEDKFEDVVYDIWPDITGDIFSKSVVQIANRVADEDIDGYLARLNEWGGAGFSYGSIFPTNRGGGINKGGFGGANNLGGPNMMYTYEIKPLNRILQPDPTDFDEAGTEGIYQGCTIEGKELNKRDKEIYVGVVIKVISTPKDGVKYYLILDDKYSKKIKIDPTTAVMLGGENHVDSRNNQPGRDEADLQRAGQMQETMRAKFVNEATPQSTEHFNWVPNEASIDDFFTWYGGTPEWGEDWQVMNTTSVNGKHAQDDGQEGMTWLNKLWVGRFDKVEIESEQFRPGDWNLEFEYKGDVYSIQSAVKAFAEDDDY